MENRSPSYGPLKRADDLQTQGRSVMFVAIDQKFAGLAVVSDPIKQSTPEAVRTLHELGLRIIMLTGDNEKTAKTVAEKLGIDEFQAGGKARGQARPHQGAENRRSESSDGG